MPATTYKRLLTATAFALSLSGCMSEADPRASTESSDAAVAARPPQCQSFGIESFAPLDTNGDALLSDSEFQVHRDQMHGDDVPEECSIPYDKGSYERLASEQGMNMQEFKEHLQEMEKRAAQGR